MRLISALIAEHGLIRFFTLTLDPGFIEGNAWEYIHAPWIKMRHRLVRRGTFKFVAVLERHKTRDVPHIHGFTGLWLPQRQWSKLWHECRGGKVVWVEKVKDGDVSSYVTKDLNVARYVGKDNLVRGYKNNRGSRTLWRSTNLKAKFELTSSSEWCIVKENMYKEDGSLSDWASKKGVWNGSEAQQGRQDVEAARRPPS